MTPNLLVQNSFTSGFYAITVEIQWSATPCSLTYFNRYTLALVQNKRALLRLRIHTYYK